MGSLSERAVTRALSQTGRPECNAGVAGRDESYGNEDLRDDSKDVVGRIEKALEEIKV